MDSGKQKVDYEKAQDKFISFVSLKIIEFIQKKLNLGLPCYETKEYTVMDQEGDCVTGNALSIIRCETESRVRAHFVPDKWQVSIRVCNDYFGIIVTRI